jgi:hypothetical protein
VEPVPRAIHRHAVCMCMERYESWAGGLRGSGRLDGMLLYKAKGRPFLACCCLEVELSSERTIVIIGQVGCAHVEFGLADVVRTVASGATEWPGSDMVEVDVFADAERSRIEGSSR